MLDTLKKFFSNSFVKTGLIALGSVTTIGVLPGIVNLAIDNFTSDNIIEVLFGYIPIIFIFFKDLFEMFVTFFNLIPSPYGTVLCLFIVMFNCIFVFKLFFGK